MKQRMNLCRLLITVGAMLAVIAGGAICFGQAAMQPKQIYNETADAHVELKEALEKARAEHKRVILVFGANWCFDCHVLDEAFHRPELASIIAGNYEVVHVDIGKGQKNQALMNGKLVYSQKNGEFENARAMSQDDFLVFLNKWKPGARND
jgi:thioredoxin 1